MRRRKRLNPIGQLALRDEREREAFKRRVKGLAQSPNVRLYSCRRCAQLVGAVDAHHMCSRTRGRGHPWVHDPDRNGVALCRKCHALVTDHRCDDWRQWIKTRAWLDQGGLLDA